MIERFAVHYVNLDPTVGVEMRKIRPCVVVSPDEMNRTLRTVIIAPLTSVIHSFPMRVPCKVAGRRGEIALDQMRSVDRSRLSERIGRLNTAESSRLLETLRAMFA